jgi:hypothetical protein
MEVYLVELDTNGCVLVHHFPVVVNHGEKELMREE